MSEEQRSTPDLISALAERSSHVAAAATELSKSIKSFEAWLSQLPGKTDTTVIIDSDDRFSNPAFHLLRFHRLGKSWVLSEAWHDAGDDETQIDWDRLVDSPIEVKIKAAKAFPDLLGRMLDAQESLRGEILQATSVIHQILPKDRGQTVEGA
jgi:hypothetical protein